MTRYTATLTNSETSEMIEIRFRAYDDISAELKLNTEVSIQGYEWYSYRKLDV